MSDETPDLNTMMTVAEAYPLKHLLGQSITWGNSGLNALEIEELTKLTREDYARICADYREWHVNIGTTIALVILALGCAVTYAFVNNGWVRIAVVVLGVSFIYRLSKREGHAEGYDAEYAAAIYKTLGIKPEEFSKMREFATRMKIDDMVVGKMNEFSNVLSI